MDYLDKMTLLFGKQSAPFIYKKPKHSNEMMNLIN